jgi:hypothetical protein
MSVRGRAALVAALMFVASAILPSAPAGASSWLTQRCSSGSMRAEVIKDGYVLRVVGRLNCGQRVPGATYAFAHFSPEQVPGQISMDKLRAYAKTPPTRFDLTNTVNSPGRHALCLVTSLRVRLSCAAFTAAPEPDPDVGLLRISDVRQISPRDPLIRSRPLDLVVGGGMVCGNCW